MTPQVLTPASVCAAARDYHARGMLTAQAPIPEDRKCQIKRGERRCAIGAALTDETMALFNAKGGDGALATSVKSLRREQVIEAADSDMRALADIQTAHDAWANSARFDEAEAPAAEAKFLALIKQY